MMSRALKIFLFILLLLVAGAIALYFFFPLHRATEVLLKNALHERGASHATLTVDSLDQNHITLSHLAVGDIEIGKANATFIPQALREGKIQNIDLEDLQIKITQQKDRYSLGEADTLLSGKSNDASSPLIWPFDKAHIKNLKLTLMREGQPPLIFAAKEATLTADSKGTLQLTLSDLQHEANPAYFTPLDINASLSPKNNIFAVSYHIADNKKQLSISGTGNYDLTNHSGAIHFSAAPITFVEGKILPQTLFPVLADNVQITSGALHAEGEWRWSDKNSDGDLTFYLENVTLQNALALILKEGVSAEGMLSGRLPVKYHNGAFSVDNASFATPAGGIIAYKPAGDSLLDANMQTDIVKQALQNFHFKTFSLLVHNESPDMMRVQMDLSGNNPELYNGKPIELHVQLRGNFMEIIKSSLNAYSLPQTIEEKMHEKK